MTGPRYRQVMQVIDSALRTRGWTRARLAEELGMSESGVKKALRARDGSFDRLVRICEVLGLKLTDVLALVDEAHGPWRLTEEQEQLFRQDTRCWWFLRDLAGAGWDVEMVIRENELDPPLAEGWLVRMERRGVLRRTEGGRVIPLDAAGRPWQAGSEHGDDVVRPVQDALLKHARARIRDKSGIPIPTGTECGLARLTLTESSVLELKQALRDVVSGFAARSRREAALHGRRELVPVGVLTVSSPFSLADLCDIECRDPAAPRPDFGRQSREPIA